MANVKSRLVVVETTYFQPESGSPYAVEARYGRVLSSDEQMFTKTCKVGQEWIPAPSGWLEGQVGLLVISNEEGKSRQTYPTEKEVAATQEKVLEIGFDTGNYVQVFGQILPGEDMRLHPVNMQALRLRCRKGEVKSVVSVFPS